VFLFGHTFEHALSALITHEMDLGLWLFYNSIILFDHSFVHMAGAWILHLLDLGLSFVCTISDFLWTNLCRAHFIEVLLTPLPFLSKISLFIFWFSIFYHSFMWLILCQTNHWIYLNLINFDRYKQKLCEHEFFIFLIHSFCVTNKELETSETSISLLHSATFQKTVIFKLFYFVLK
jgi:hypothetical protein